VWLVSQKLEFTDKLYTHSQTFLSIGAPATVNPWTKKSIEIANEQNYLDRLLDVYPMNPEGPREIDQQKWSEVEKYFTDANLPELVETLLRFDLFPIKDSYIAYLKRDKGAVARNSETINRLGKSLIAMGLPRIKEKCSEPKETNRQIGPMFRNWVNRGALNVDSTSEIDKFKNAKENLLLDLGDEGLKNFANKYLDYNGKKGLDLIGRFGGEFVVVEAKFLTDFGGHQNAQFNDAITLVENKQIKATKVAVLDGVPYIERKKDKMCLAIRSNSDHNIMSVLVLKDFLHQL
jgi:hypothetical protein